MAKSVTMPPVTHILGEVRATQLEFVLDNLESHVPFLRSKLCRWTFRGANFA